MEHFQTTSVVFPNNYTNAIINGNFQSPLTNYTVGAAGLTTFNGKQCAYIDSNGSLQQDINELSVYTGNYY